MTIDQLKAVLEKKGYSFFERGRYNLNLVGIRRHDRPNAFDDTFIVAYKDATDTWNLHEFPCTTEPGKFYLENPTSPKGTAVLAPGQYSGAFTIGMHKGQYRALVQYKPLPVFRDANRNATAECAPNIVETGTFGINIHRAAAQGESIQVDKWSAGCQVLANAKDFQLLMGLVDRAALTWGKLFTYTLLNEADL